MDNINNIAFTYNCFYDIKAGDIVYVDGKRAGYPGMVVFVDSEEITLKEPSPYIYCINKIFRMK